MNIDELVSNFVFSNITSVNYLWLHVLVHNVHYQTRKTNKPLHQIHSFTDFFLTKIHKVKVESCHKEKSLLLIKE